MEDGWILAQAIELEQSRSSENAIRDALHIFEGIRLPYYQKMYVQRDVGPENFDLGCANHLLSTGMPTSTTNWEE